MTPVFSSLPLEGSRENRNTVIWRLKKEGRIFQRRKQMNNTAFASTGSNFYVYKYSKITLFVHTPKYYVYHSLL